MAKNKRDLQDLYSTLTAAWPDQGSALTYRSCFELLIAVILSAQCTDEQVNKVTPVLFARWPTPESLGAAAEHDVAAVIHSTGFFRTKSKNIIASARIVCERYASSVPDTIEELLTLPGVGRKTANLIVSVCYGKPGIVVDTHVKRSARRIGLTPHDDPEKIERDIAGAYEPEQWTAFSFALNRHGKYVCAAKAPACEVCPVQKLCDTYTAARRSSE